MADNISRNLREYHETNLKERIVCQKQDVAFSFIFKSQFKFNKLLKIFW